MDLITPDLPVRPEVSVIVPTYNRRDLLKQAIGSVRAQTFTNWECIIVDDGSNDGTFDLVQNLKREDDRFQYFKRPSEYIKGAASCRNYGFIKSRGRYIQWLDDDDLISKNKLELQVNSLNILGTDLHFTTCAWDQYWPGKILDLKNFSIQEKIVKPQEFYKILAEKQTFLPASTYLIPRQLSIHGGFWNPMLTLNDDAEYFNRILLQAKGLHYTKGCYALYREHSGTRLSKRNDVEGLESFLLSLRLMHAQLLKEQIEVKSFFRWKLKRIILDYTQEHKCILEFHRFFFLEHGIDLKKIKYYKFRFHLYKKLFPLYKTIRKNSIKKVLT